MVDKLSNMGQPSADNLLKEIQNKTNSLIQTVYFINTGILIEAEQT